MRRLDGRRLGTIDGAVICDGCNARTDLAHGRGTEPDPHSAPFTAYVTERSGGEWDISRVWCQDCDEREIDRATEGHDEVMVELDIEFIGLSQPPCMVIDVSLLDRSPPGDA